MTTWILIIIFSGGIVSHESLNQFGFRDQESCNKAKQNISEYYNKMQREIYIECFENNIDNNQSLGYNVQKEE